MEESSDDIEDYIDYQVEWEDRSNCACNIAYFPVGGFYIINHWRKKFLRPILSNIAFIIIFADLVFDLYYSLNFKEYIISLVFCSLAFLATAVSYWLIIVIGPGYVPYNWKLTHKKRFTWKERMNYITIYDQQVQCARMSERPARSSFSLDARRFVLRADHLCIWTNSWIGFKNHRYFILFTLWFVIYSCLWFACRYNWYLLIPQLHWYYLISAACAIVLITAASYSFYYLVKSLINLKNNITGIEKYNRRNVKMYDKGCMNNFEEIFGTRKCIICWCNPFCPVPRVHDGFYNSY